jgi:ketosteroid isomerase-like protein
VSAALLVAVLSLLPGTASPAADPRVAAELKRATQELMSAVAPGNWAVWEKYADDAVLYTAEDGRILTKAQLKEEFQPLPTGFSGTIDVVSSDVRQYGDTAVVGNEIQEHETVFGQKIEAGYHSTDTWIRRGGKWRLVASQVLVRLQDPAAAPVDPKIFDAYVGRYDLSPSVSYTVTREGDKLFGQRTGRVKGALLPETENVFFTPGAPRTRKIFVRDANGPVTKMIDRRDGRDLVWTRAAAQ